MVKVNIALPDDVHRRMKVFCAENGLKIKDYLVKIISDDIVKNRKRG